jgi:hypothetical protein
MISSLRSRLAIAVVALVAPAAVFAATPSEYRTQATAVCKGTSAKLAKIESPQTAVQLNRFLKASLPVLRSHYAALNRLSPPRALRSLHLKALRLEKRQIDGIQALVRKIDGGADPEEAFNAADARLSKAGDAEAATWTKLRVPACAEL